MQVTRKYGWTPGLPRMTDAKYRPLISGTVLPHQVDLRSKCPAPYDQGDLGSCTANATGGLGHFLMKRLKQSDWVPARLAMYFWTRVTEKSTADDAGASVRDAIHTLSHWGMPRESLWPYDVTKFAVRPLNTVLHNANAHKIKTPLSVPQSDLAIKTLLAGGWPVVFGFTVYPSFESKTVAKTGKALMPGTREKPVGGHAVLIVGYDDDTKTFLVRNSWGEDWGMGGYFTLPYDYVLSSDLADDFWTATGFRTFGA